MKKNLISLLLFLGAVAFTSCEKGEDEPNVDPTSAKVLVINEGNYGKGNSSLSAISFEGETTNNLFQKENNIPLGDVAQSISYLNGKYFTVLNASSKIQVTSANDYKLATTIAIKDADYSPLYMAKVSDNQAVVTGSDFYGSNNYKGCLYVINTVSNEFVETIVAPQSCNTIINTGQKLLVNAPVIYDWSNYPDVSVLKEGKILVFDTSNLKVTPTEINASLIDKSQFVTDKNGNVWALGNSEIFRINPSTAAIETTIKLKAYTGSGSRLTINSSGDKLYFNAYNSSYETEIYSLSISGSSDVEEFTAEGIVAFYNMSMSPDNHLYISDALDYAQTGIVYEFDLEGKMVNKYTTGIIPGDILFTENNKN